MAYKIMLTCTYCGKEFQRGETKRPHNPALRPSGKSFCSNEHKWAYDRRHYEDFWCSVAKSEDPDGCWLWQGPVAGNGYGSIEYKGKIYQAHRRSYELVNGQIPEGKRYHGTVVRHVCDTPLCVRPEHLILGTQADNGRDMASRGRAVSKLTVDQVRAIRIDARSYSKIGADYGLCLATVSEIKRRMIWKHLD